MKTITICGGGSLGHVIGAWLSAKNKAIVNILTNRPTLWSKEIEVDTPNGLLLTGHFNEITDKPSEVIPNSDVIILCLPGNLIIDELIKIRPYLREDTLVGSVFSSTGFFFEGLKLLNSTQPLWGFQRVPFIARVGEYGKTAHLLGYKKSLSIAVENIPDDEKQVFTSTISEWFEKPVLLLKNYLEASISNSNPLLHTSRLYTLFGGSNEGKRYDHRVLFYEEWSEESADMLIKMDKELFKLIDVLPVSSGFLPRILDYYESYDPKSLAKKLASIPSFKGIESPMIQMPDGAWGPDTQSRYFVEDFCFGLRYIHDLAHEYHISAPNIDKVYAWGKKMVGISN